MTIDWNAVRNEVEIDPRIAYLNTGTSGLVLKVVHDKVMELRKELHHNPTGYVWRSHYQTLWASRERFARHIHTSPDRVVFFANISHAINTFCLSLAEHGDSCFTSEESEILITDHEYGAMQRAWRRVADRKGWSLATASLPILSEDPNDYVRAVVSKITRGTRVLFLSHVLYTTGHVLPLKDIVKKAREIKPNLVIFVDGAHAPGMLPLEIETLDVDFYAANLHKWFMSPVGAAFLYVRHGRESLLEPWQVSWGYSATHDGASHDQTELHFRNEFGSTPWIYQFEMEGTRDITPWLVLPYCCDFFESLGYQAVTRRQWDLSQYVRSRLNGVIGLSLVTPANETLRGGLTAFAIPEGLDTQSLRRKLCEEHLIEVNFIDHPQSARIGRYLRVSTHVYNNESEIDRLVDALPDAAIQRD